jgi:hypothetical protein
MPVSVKKVGSKYRVVESETGKVASRNNKPVDGGGHSNRNDAVKQVHAINMNRKK